MAIGRIRTQNILDNIGNFDYGPPPDVMGGYDMGMEPSPTYPSQGALPRIGTYDPSAPVDMQQGTQGQTMADLMQSLYHPEHEASDAYAALLNKYPQRERPSIARRLIASGVAIKGGAKGAEEVMEAPNRRNLADWTAQVQPRYQAANLERQSNINERTLAYNAATTTIAQRKADETERNNRAKQAIAEHRASVYEYKARNPDAKFDFSGPYVMVSDPATGKVTRTDIPTGSMNEMDKVNLQGKWRVEAARVGGQEARKTEDVRQAGRERLADRRGWQVLEDAQGNLYSVNPQPAAGQEKLVPYEPASGQAPAPAPNTPRVTPFPGSPDKPAAGTLNKPGTPRAAGGGNVELNVQRQRFNTAKEVADTVPGANKWIKFTSPTTFKILQPGVLTSKADREIIKNITARIYGNPGGGRGGGPGTAPNASTGGPQVTSKEYSPSRDATRITYADGTTKIVPGRQ